jgi:uncharacterized protein YndB with AHSA1/START domain
VKWALLAIAVVIVIIVVVIVAGMIISQAHVASRTARFSAPPEAVWKAVTDVQAYPTWRGDVKAIERLPDGRGGPAWVEISRRGERLPLETVQSIPPRTFVARIADPNLPFGGTWTYEIAPADGGSTLTITERGEIYNPLFRFMTRFVFGYTATMEGYLQALGEKLGK